MQVSQNFLNALQAGAQRRSIRVVWLPPNKFYEEDAYPLEVTACTVNVALDQGSRYTANIEIVSQVGEDTYGMVSTPGSTFLIFAGVDLGGTAGFEEVRLGTYEAVSGSVNVTGKQISLSLSDLWVRLERCRFVVPKSFSYAYDRTAIIRGLVEDADYYAYVDDRTEDGGGTANANTWEESRTEAILEVAKDGALDAAYDASGAFRIQPQKVLDPTNPVWILRTGPNSNILTTNRERPFDRLYNTAVVRPSDDEQTWVTQIRQIADPDHPQHQDKVGVVPYFYSSPMIQTAAQAIAAADGLLFRILGRTETIQISNISNPALEVGDTILVLHEPTETDPGLEQYYFVQSWSMDLFSGEQTIVAISNSDVALEDGTAPEDELEDGGGDESGGSGG